MSSLLVPQVTVLRGDVPRPFCSIMAKVPTQETVVFSPKAISEMIKRLKSRKGYQSMATKYFNHSIMFDISVESSLSEKDAYDFQLILGHGLIKILSLQEIDVVFEETSPSHNAN